MTLVVAKKIGNFIQVASDSKLTSVEREYDNPYLFGALKTIIINNNICISFAGIIQRGDTNYPSIALNEIYKDNNASLSKIVDVLKQVHCDSGHEIDFIVGYHNDSLTELVKIQNGIVHSNADSYWIGDIDGFNLFQQHYVQNTLCRNDISIDDNMSLLTDSFAEVVMNGSIASIDGFVVNVFSRNGYFEYMPGFNLDICKKIVIKPKESCIITYGEASDGSFGIAYFTNEYDSPPAIAIFYPHGEMGVLYCPYLCLNKIYINNVNDKMFINIVLENYGIELRGFLLDLNKGIATYIGKSAGRFLLKNNIQYSISSDTERCQVFSPQTNTPTSARYSR